ncbi:reverse transcriptase domain, reverse transcriptase zinc-binding domain protein [Tanacetum coccineum]
MWVKLTLIVFSIERTWFKERDERTSFSFKIILGLPLIVRCHIDRGFLPDDGPGTRWNNLLQKKINIFIWRTLRDRLPSKWNLSRKRIEVNSLNCPICDKGIDSAYHTLWVCSLATTVWIRVLNWMDLHPPSISNLNGLYTWVDGLHMSHNKKAILEVICGVVLWSL